MCLWTWRVKEQLAPGLRKVTRESQQLFYLSQGSQDLHTGKSIITPIYLGTFTKLLSKWSYHDHFGASSFWGSSSFSPQHLLPSVSFLSLFMSYSLPWAASSKKVSLKKRLTFRSINLLPERDP